MQRPPRPSQLLRGVRGYCVVFALVVVSYALCAVQTSADPSAAAFLVQLVTVAVTLRVADVPPAAQRAGWLTLAVAGAATIGVAALGSQGLVLDVVLSAASAAAFLIAPVAILVQQFRRRRADVEALLAAIAAYVMIGMAFTFVYNLLALLAPSPVFGDGTVDSLTSQLFFSFTTLTTVGYGNLVPVSPGVQTVAVVEAITGQLFLVIAIARILSAPKRKQVAG
ncbi:potassium channel family protein [Microbacterium sp. P01]|uniref:potassium channel family protein n=1 Tax=Microbacterium sp. P01 TaxID=3366261 RepID=UPI00366D884B